MTIGAVSLDVSGASAAYADRISSGPVSVGRSSSLNPDGGTFAAARAITARGAASATARGFFGVGRVVDDVA